MSTANKAAMCASTRDAKSPAGLCPFQRSDIGIIPVRYALDDMNEQGLQMHPFPASDPQWKGRFTPKQRQYTLRQLRDGWLYVYDETDTTFHEYQIEGYEFTKIDWSSDEADKPANKRGSKGETKSCLVYPAKNTIYMAFAHQRWTWRMCEYMRSHESNCSVWMRKVNLKQFKSTLAHPHAGLSSKLGHYAADIGVNGAPAGIFDSTCTPLASTEAQTDSFKHVADKPGCWDVDYRVDLPAQDCGMFIALDDPLADVSDLFLPLAEEITLRSAIHKDEDNIHKLQMAEITRNLGRVRLKPEELPEQINDDPMKILEFERQLTEYLAIQSLADKESSAFESNPSIGNTPFTPLQEEALEKHSELKEKYHFTPSDEQKTTWEKNTLFSDEVNWSELDEFLTQHYTQLKDQDKRIAMLYQDFMEAFEQLGTDPFVIGIDNQDEAHLTYLLSLISQYVQVIKQTVNTEKEYATLESALSLDSPKTLFSLASLGFSNDNLQALNDHVEDLSNHLLSTNSSGDMGALSGAIASWGGFTDDIRIQDNKWFKALAEPVQLSFIALKNAVTGQAKESWRGIANLLFPHQMNTATTPQGMISNLRLVILEALVNPEAIVIHNPDYPAHFAAWQRKMNAEVMIIRQISQPPSGQLTPKNHQIQTMRSAQQRMQKLLSSELPVMVMLKYEAVNNAAKQMLNEAIERSWQQGKDITQASWNKMGKMGGVVAILNLWNTAAVLQNIHHKAEQYPESDLWTNPAVREATYATSYAVSAVTAVWRDATWGKMATNQSLLSESLKIALRSSTHSYELRQSLATFAKTTAAVSLFGLIATALETWESYDKFKDMSHSPMERFGYGLKGFSTVIQTIAFGGQLTALISSRLGWTFRSFGLLGSIIAPWILTTFMVGSILFLISIIIINAFKRTELEKWLLHSAWGKDAKHWEAVDELTRLEQIIHKPQVRLNKVISSLPSKAIYGSAAGQQWQLEISLPMHTKGKSIGLQVTRTPTQNKYSYVTSSLKTAVMVNEQNGIWSKDETGNSVYRLDLGGTTKDSTTVFISLPFNWQASEHDMLGYIASGSSKGELVILPARKDNVIRTIKVEVNDGF
ncbi:T6SS effector BTH_I2691 family protein [Aliivibrio logei]|uniref:T6SS effector BTH_I2691 family protein n=1 Tax=Aliivibrio logei TaxID=688 RepID=UPI0003A8D9EE|nr:T6SS effector BTH_I2691 family protein [Aliivibrio logei]